MRPWLLSLLVLACPAPLRRPASMDVTLSGSVSQGGFDRRAEPIAGATVSLALDGRLVSARSAGDGEWRLSLPAPSGLREATLTAWAPGFAPLVRTFTAGPFTELQLSFALEPLEPLECVDGACADGTQALRWVGAPSGAQASAALTPVPEPGLAAAVAVELDAGVPLEGSLWLRIPRDAWPRLVDLRPDSGAVELGLRALLPDATTWSAPPPGRLLTETGAVVSEAELEAVRAGEFFAGVVAEVSPLARGLVGVVAPAPSGCVTGKLFIDDAPAPGATLFPSGGAPAATTSDGTVCFEAPLASEPRAARVQYAGVVFASTTVPSPTTVGRCGSACLALGTLQVRSERVSTIAPCRVELRIVDEQARPLAGAVAIGMDDAVTQAGFTSVCGRMGTRCTLTAAADDQGRASLVLPVQSGVELAARGRAANGPRTGRLSLPGCPREPVTLEARTGADTVAPVASFTASGLSWTPPVPASRVVVSRDGGVVWSLRSGAGLLPPLVFGAAPPGATVEVPATGPSAADDLAQVSCDGILPTGLFVSGSTSARRE